MKRYSRGMLLLVMAEKEEEYSTRQNLNEFKADLHTDWIIVGVEVMLPSASSIVTAWYFVSLTLKSEQSTQKAAVPKQTGCDVNF
jgi:hypothetical protein